MPYEQTNGQLAIPAPARSGPLASRDSRSRIYVFTDLVGSLDFKRRRGDTLGQRLLAQHDGAFRECLGRHGGRENKDTGDGFLATFESAAEAVQFALEFQHRVGAIPSPEPLCCRVGIHRGRAYSLDNPPEATNLEKFVGLDVDLASRVMNLAQPGQILMTREVFDGARNELALEFDGRAPEWVAHGVYQMKGTEEEFEIFEVGVNGSTPLSAPPDNAKLQRAAVPSEASLPGWRPSAGALIPGRDGWRLVRQLGQGGIGEVWLGEEDASGAARAFKFCFSAARLRLLRREHTLFRLLNESLDESSSIAPIASLRLDAAPFWLEMEYFPEGDLLQWAERQGGIGALPLEARLDLAAQIAEGLAQAHSVGVLHKDVKPRNVLIRADSGRPRAVLADFGIGDLLDPEALNSAGITASGFTRTISHEAKDSSSGSGTTLYMAPELLACRPPSVQSDLYAAGVILFQLVTGDFGSPLGQGWERAVEDELLRDDIAACVDREPSRRWASAAQLAENLRAWRQRGERLRAKREAARKEALSQRRQRVLKLSLGGVIAISALLGFLYFRDRQRLETETRLRRAAEQALVREAAAKTAAEDELYSATIEAAQLEVSRGESAKAEAALWRAPESRRAIEWGFFLALARPELAVLHGHAGEILDGALSPDGLRLVTGGNDGIAIVWDLVAARELARFVGHAAPVSSVAISPNTAAIATASEDKTARLWNPDGTAIAVLAGHDAPVNRVRFAPDGARVLTCSDDHTARLWDAESGRLVATLTGHENWVFDCAFDPAGALVATASDDGTARIWRADSGELSAVLRGHSGPVNSVAFSPDGTRVVTGSDDRSARIWDAPSGAAIGEPFAHNGTVRKVAFAPDGDRLLAVTDPAALVWRISTRETINRISWSQTQLADARFSPDAANVIVANAVGRMALVPALSDGPPQQVAQVADARAGESLPAANSFVIWGGRSVRLWPDSSANWTVPIQYRGVSCASWSPDGRWLAAGDHERSITLFDFKSAAAPRHWKGHDGRLRSLAFDPSGELFASGGEDGKIHIWKVANQSCLLSLEGHGDVVRRVEFSPDGKLLLSAAQDGAAILWEFQSGRLLRRIEPGRGWITGAHFIGDGKALAIAGPDLGISIRETHSGAELRGTRLEAIRPVALAADGASRRLAVGGAEGALAVLDAESLEVIWQEQGHSREITDVQFASGGARILSSSAFDSIRIWDARSGRGMSSLFPEKLIYGVAAPPDETTLAVATGGGLELIDLAPLRLFAGVASEEDRRARVKAWRLSSLEKRRAIRRFAGELEPLLAQTKLPN